MRPARDASRHRGRHAVRSQPLPFFRAAVGRQTTSPRCRRRSRSGWLTSGPRAIELEKRLGEYLGAAHTIAVSSCSEAMLPAACALGIGPGDEVITTPITFASTVHAIIHNGATRRFWPTSRTTPSAWIPRMSSAALTPRSAIMPVHFAGQAVPHRARSWRLQSARGLDGGGRRRALVRRARGRHAQSAPSARHARSASTPPRISPPPKAVPSPPEDEALAQRLRLLGYHGMSRDSWSRYTDAGSWYYEVDPGYKCNLSDLHAALGLTQLAKIDRLLDERGAWRRRSPPALASV